MCVAIAYGIATVAYCHSPALSAEVTVNQAGNTDTIRIVSEPSGIDVSSEASKVSEPLNTSARSAEELAIEAFYAQNQEIQTFILQLRRKKYVLSANLVALQQGLDIYLPVGALADTLNFDSSKDTNAYVIRGTYLGDAGDFTIDATNGMYALGGETNHLPDNSVIVNDFGNGQYEVYMLAEALNQIWPLELETDFFGATVKINTRRKLPFELELERRARQEKAGQTSEKPEEEKDLVYIKNPYPILGPHVFNLGTSFYWDGSEQTLSNTTNITGHGDLLGTNARYRATTTHTEGDLFELQNLHFLFSRENHDGKTLPFGLTLLQGGDVNSKPSPLVSRNISGRGITFSTKEKRKNLNQNFDQVTIKGYGEPGWDVEIYRAAELLDYGQIDSNGEYSFDDIPLTFGKNTFKIVLYGPQGQVEERTETYKIKNSILAAGETIIEGGAVDYNSNLYTPNQKRKSKLGGAYNLTVKRGVNRWMSAFISGAKIPTSNGDRRYASVGSDISAFGGVGRIEAYKEIDGGQALDMRFSTSFAGLNTNIRANIYDEFESPIAGFGNSRKSFDGQIYLSKGFQIGDVFLNLSGTARETHYEFNENRRSYSSTQSIVFKESRLSHDIQSTFVEGERETTTGTLGYSRTLTPAFNFRTNLGYTAYPEKSFDNTSMQLSYRGGRRFNAGLKVGQELQGERRTNVGLSGSYDFEKFIGSGDIRWSKDNGIDLVFSANTTFGPTGEDKLYVATTKYDGFTTGLSMRVFEDLDLDGTFSDDDIPVPGIKLKINGRRTPPSDENGMIEMDGAGPPGLADITLDRKTLGNDFLAPLKDGYQTVLRQGTKPFIEFPLYMTGTIDGTVRYPDGTPVPGTIVQLLDRNGNLLQEVPTLFDGFYVFEFVRPGTYKVRLSPSHQFNVPPITVLVTSEDLFAYGVDLFLTEQATEGSATVDTVRDGGRVAQTYHAHVAEGTLKPAPTSSNSLFDTAVRAVRIGEYPYKVRLVLDLSAPSVYKISSEDEGHVINIDLASTAWDATRKWKFDTHPMFNDAQVFTTPDGNGTRLRLTSRKPVEVFYNAKLPAADGKPDRIYIDFMRVK